MLSHLHPQSRVYKLRQPLTCSRCHAKSDMMAEEGVHQPAAARQYQESVHGRGLLAGGLKVAPSCNDCHGAHEILAASDPASTVHKHNVPKTCGKCHSGVEAIYAQSVHGQLMESGDEEGAVCSSCHRAHAILEPGEAAFKLFSDNRCGECHESRLEHYRETFHGKAMALGGPGVAACYDCHGYHDILPISNPASRLSEQNRLETCRKCHPNAAGGFAGYIAHADHFDSEHHPVLYWTFMFMTSIVLGTFAFFGLHTLLWVTRSFVLYRRDPAAFKKAKTDALMDDDEYVRFPPFERFLHILVVTSFLLLVATGMPLKFYEAGWAQSMVNLFGGLEASVRLHRVGAVLTFLYFGLHLVSLIRRLIRGRQAFRNPKTGRYSPRLILRGIFGPDSMVPGLVDLKDFIAHQRWFFGRGPRPDFDRWTYWEKFDYFGVFWGVGAIGMSGLIMWFPETFTLFLPGWIINVAMIVHSDEALLAAGFIFTFHFFNVHFRAEKFPLDPVIFSGRISRTEMLHERKRWYDRLVASGSLEKIRVKDEWKQWKRVMHPVGFLAFGIGLVLLVMILWAMGRRLIGV